jgi:hypothetical protein
MKLFLLVLLFSLMVNPESIRRIVHAYGKVQPNLVKHDPAFPQAEKLLTLVKQGRPVYGMLGVGKGKDSEGSEWIIRELQADEDRPLWISVWGGANTLVFKDNKVSLWRWRDDFQHDFAARMDWCTKSYAEANHPPVIRLGNPEQITVKSGQGFGLDAFETTDPDGDSYSFLWFNYPEAGTWKNPVPVEGAENAHGAYIIAPKVDKEVTAHFILKVTDKGSPRLSAYKRVIVTIQPE